MRCTRILVERLFVSPSTLIQTYFSDIIGRWSGCRKAGLNLPCGVPLNPKSKTKIQKDETIPFSMHEV